MGEGNRKLISGEIVLGRNVHNMCFPVEEPEADDEVAASGEQENYIGGVLTRYRKSLDERTEHHLGKQLFLIGTRAIETHLNKSCYIIN